MSEQSVREKWQAFCDDAKALVKDGYRIQPGRTLDEPCGISETAAVKKAEPESAAPKKEDPKPVRRMPTFGGDKKDDASE